MIDSMTRDDVLSALGEISKHFEGCTKKTYGSIHKLFHRWTNAADWAAAYLNDPAPTVGGWISVKNRLPEPEEKVIIWAKTGCMRYAQYHNDGSNNPWYVYEDDARAWTNVISHWMPLPEPPKEEHDD